MKRPRLAAAKALSGHRLRLSFIDGSICTVSLAGELNMFDRITHDPTVLAGRATLRGLRISVAHVINLVANGMTPAQIGASPSALRYSSTCMKATREMGQAYSPMPDSRSS